MKKICILLLSLSYCVVCLATQPIEIRGRISCEGKSIEGVVVTDGENFTKSNSKGRYCLNADAENRYIYISSPSGYDVHADSGLIKFYRPMPSKSGNCDFSLTKRTTDDTRHGFIAIADPQVWARKEFALLSAAAKDIEATVATYNTPFHGICCGDIISNDHSFYSQYNSVISQTGLLFHNAMGNHDMTLYGRTFEGSERRYEEFFGPAYYSYNIGKIHYVVLNNNFYIGRDYFYIGYLDERQMHWLEQDLSYIPKGSTVVLCMHIPSSCTQTDRNRFSYAGAGGTMINHKGLYEILKPYNAHIISGHTHTTYNQQLAENLYEHVTPAVSGAWWQGELCTDGTPRGYGVYEVDGDNIRWYYKSTGHPTDHQMTLYTEADAKEFAGFVVANIWASDPSWSVELIIDGVKAGKMERFEAYDPAARRMYASTDKLDHKWIYPSISDHYYRSPMPKNAKVIEVTATDKFGNTYRKSLEIK